MIVVCVKQVIISIPFTLITEDLFQWVWHCLLLKECTKLNNMKKFTEQDEELIRLELCSRLPYGLRGRVVATCVDTNYVDMDGFYGEKYFDVDVELDKIDIGNYEIHVTALGNDDLCDYIEESQTMGEPWTIFDFKPYLRPMSSMTEEEKKELHDKFDIHDWYGEYRYYENKNWYKNEKDFYSFVDWVNAHHFDYRGLIEKGLALKAPEGMYKID